MTNEKTCELVHVCEYCSEEIALEDDYDNSALMELKLSEIDKDGDGIRACKWSRILCESCKEKLTNDLDFFVKHWPAQKTIAEFQKKLQKKEASITLPLLPAPPMTPDEPIQKSSYTAPTPEDTIKWLTPPLYYKGCSPPPSGHDWFITALMALAATILGGAMTVFALLAGVFKV